MLLLLGAFSYIAIQPLSVFAQEATTSSQVSASSSGNALDTQDISFPITLPTHDEATQSAALLESVPQKESFFDTLIPTNATEPIRSAKLKKKPIIKNSIKNSIEAMNRLR